MENVVYKPMDNLRQLDYRFNADQAKIYLCSFIDEGLLELMMMRTDFIMKEWEKAEKDLEEITIILSSYGGDVYETLSILDYFNYLKKTHKIKVNVECYGKAMSSAILLLAAATGKRKMSKHTFVFFDEFKINNASLKNKNAGVGFKTSDGLNNEQTDQDVKLDDHIDKLNDYMLKIITSSTNKEYEFWDNIQKKNDYLTAEKCLEYKIIDKII